MDSQPRRSISIIIVLAVVVILQLIAQITRAQDAPVLPDSTPFPTDMSLVTLVPTHELLLESDLTATPATPAPAELTTLPTDESAAALTGTDEPTLEDTTVTDLPTPSVTPEFTALNTDSPSPTLNPTDEATLVSIPANIAITARTTHAAEGDMLTLTVSGERLANVYNVAVACRVDPSVLLGIQATSGDMLLPNRSTTTDSGYQADGLWILISSQVDAAPSLVSTGTLWTITYQVVGTGVTQISCQTQIADRNNQPLQLTNTNPVLTVEGYQATAVDVSPTLSATETEAPVSEKATEIITETATISLPMSTPDNQYHISGQIGATIPLRMPVITIREAAMNQPLEVQSNGTFSADLPAGDYQLIITALYCLPRVVPMTITDKPLRLPTITLIGGDVDQNGVTDRADANFITQNFGLAASLASSSADLNGDGEVNIYDLALVSANIPINQ